MDLCFSFFFPYKAHRGLMHLRLHEKIYLLNMNKSQTSTETANLEGDAFWDGKFPFFVIFS